MDLKDVIAIVDQEANEAHRAFHAGHHENAEKHLYTIEKTVVEYLRMPATPAGDVTKATEKQVPEDEQKEKPAEVPGAPAPIRGVVPFAAARQNSQSPEAEKPTQ